MHSKIIGYIFILLPFTSFAQPSNDDCLSAFFIRNIEQYCSGPTEFSNSTAEPSPQANPSCWREEDQESDIWFSFAPGEPGVYIQLQGEAPRNPYTLDNSAIAIYEGTCGNLTEIACNNVSESRSDFIELTLTELVIGRVYYVRIGSAQNTSGTFQLCIDQFRPVRSPESDCVQAVVLCDKTSFVVDNLQGIGDDPNEVTESCLDQEFASAWYTWTARTSGTLTFTITPNNPDNSEEDLDFAVYRLPSGLGNCNDKELIRCMASGETQGQSSAQNEPCFGATGLRNGDPDLFELPGCAPGDNNFLSPLDMIAGESYALVVNNYSQSGYGFNIVFGGTGTFQGPTPDFEITAVDAFECDKTITFTNLSTSTTDMITGYEWNFGDGADPIFASGPGPHDVVYASFGTKLAALTIESSRGCTSTEIIEFDVAACCADDSDLDLSLNALDLICHEIPEGYIEINGIGGFPEYLYNINGEGYQPSPIFNELFAGEYTLSVQDQKGCEATEMITLTEPPPLMVMVSEDDSVDLGFSLPLSSTFGPPDRDITYSWGPVRGLSCTDCPDPVATPPGTTTYILTITDQDGCQATDDVTLVTPLIRPIEAPNIILAGGNNENSYFNVSGNIAAQVIEKFRIYDRWGNVLYSLNNVPVTDQPFTGWDGTVQGQPVNPGVYVWFAEIRFIDDEVLAYKGDVTVIR